MSMLSDARAVCRDRPDDVRAALNHLRNWTGRPMTLVDVRRLAYRLHCGHSPNAAAARELSYMLSCWLRPWHSAQRGPFLIGL